MDDIAGKEELKKDEISNIEPWWDEEVAEEEQDIGQIDDYDITSSPNDFNIITIFSFIESGVVSIPGFQRNYVWDKIRASKLIESIIIGLPIPQIFLYETGRNKFLVIDGQQRLMSIYYYIKQRFPKKDKRSRLRKIFAEHGLIPDEILQDDTYFEKFNLRLPAKLPDKPNKFNGMNYATMGDYKSSFDLRVIRNIIVQQRRPEDDDSAIYEIFNRLNSGGINLKPQEIRTSLYHSEFYTTLYKINIWTKWRRFLGLIEPDLHMKDIEFLLRGFAIMIDGDNYKPSMSKFLNGFSKKCKDISKEQASYLEALFNSFLISCENLEDDAFFTSNGRFSITRYEAVFAAVCDRPFKKRELVNFKLSSEKIENLKKDEEFSKASLSETASAANVLLRRKRATTILYSN